MFPRLSSLLVLTVSPSSVAKMIPLIIVQFSSNASTFSIISGNPVRRNLSLHSWPEKMTGASRDTYISFVTDCPVLYALRRRSPRSVLRSISSRVRSFTASSINPSSSTRFERIYSLISIEFSDPLLRM
jgi:hypothetical protein